MRAVHFQEKLIGAGERGSNKGNKEKENDRVGVAKKIKIK